MGHLAETRSRSSPNSARMSSRPCRATSNQRLPCSASNSRSSHCSRPPGAKSSLRQRQIQEDRLKSCRKPCFEMIFTTCCRDFTTMVLCHPRETPHVAKPQLIPQRQQRQPGAVGQILRQGQAQLLARPCRRPAVPRRQGPGAERPRVDSGKAKMGSPTTRLRPATQQPEGPGARRFNVAPLRSAMATKLDSDTSQR